MSRTSSHSIRPFQPSKNIFTCGILSRSIYNNSVYGHRGRHIVWQLSPTNQPSGIFFGNGDVFRIFIIHRYRRGKVSPVAICNFSLFFFILPSNSLGFEKLHAQEFHLFVDCLQFTTDFYLFELRIPMEFQTKLV